MPLLLLTRPEAASERFAAQISYLGLPVVISPALRIVPVAHDAARVAAAAGLVFTSENAVRFAGRGGGRPAICVGTRTAAVAEAAGFCATAGPGDAARLMPMVQDLGPGWLHLHGVHVARVLPVPGMAVYDQQALALNAAAQAALAGDSPVIVPLFSPRSASVVAKGAVQARAPLWLVAISAAADLAWENAGGPRPALRSVALTPDAPGVEAAVTAMLQGNNHPFRDLRP